MTVREMDDMFETLYNNIGSNQAPGLNAYEKSVFLTKAQDEILKNYFNPKSKGNNTQEGFDANPKRQVDFSSIISVYNVELTNSQIQGGKIDGRSNTKSVSLPEDLMMAINETVLVDRDSKNVTLQVIPLRFDEYTRLMSKPYKRPLKYQAWRISSYSINSNYADIITGPNDSPLSYLLRYVRRPNPIIVSNLDGLTIEGKGTTTECELDPILHEEIIQRAVELAKIAWTSTGNDNTQAVIQAGQRSE